MLQSPSKRRKISATTAVPATSNNTNAPIHSTPTTPTRASYLSPTKASLARSHPHLVSPNKRQSLTEPRGRVLRNELLGKIDSNSSLIQKVPATEGGDNRSEQTDKSGSSDQKQEVLLVQTTASAKRDPLKQRQPATHDQLPGRSASPDFVPPQIVPTIIKKPHHTARAPSRLLSNEPELPPTPVQLGIDAPPERPRGLSSSSPRGSKSGSGRRRIRALNGQSVTSSPLKPKARRPTMHDLESEPDEAQENRGSQAPIPNIDIEELPEELEEKTRTLRSLRLELAKLKAGTKDVEGALNYNDVLENFLSKPSFIDLIKTGTRPAPSPSIGFEHNPSLANDMTPHHKLFAPGNLQLETETSTKVVKANAKVVHHLAVTAPSPWPSHLFLVNFEVVTDAEAVQVEKITWVDVLKGHTQSPGIQDELHKWIKQRLSSELHRLDVAGLIWGLGMYFIASVERAKVFRALASKHKPVKDGYNSDEEEDDDLKMPKDGLMTLDEAIILSRYLTKTHLTFEADQNSTMTTRRTRTTVPKIMAIWKLEPLWHGEIRSICEIAVSGIPDSAQEEVTDLFESVIKVAGFEKAFGAVWGTVMKAREQKADEVVKAPTKQRKRFS